MTTSLFVSIDHLTIPSRCGKGPLRRVSEVFDCWFESGSMPYAQVHYPFESKREFEDAFPADFIAEGIDQTRGWYVTHVCVPGLSSDVSLGFACFLKWPHTSAYCWYREETVFCPPPFSSSADTTMSFQWESLLPQSYSVTVCVNSHGELYLYAKPKQNSSYVFLACLF